MTISLFWEGSKRCKARHLPFARDFLSFEVSSDAMRKHNTGTESALLMYRRARSHRYGPKVLQTHSKLNQIVKKKAHVLHCLSNFERQSRRLGHHNAVSAVGKKRLWIGSANHQIRMRSKSSRAATSLIHVGNPTGVEVLCFSRTVPEKGK